jgi:zinc transport system permease protein
MDDFILRALGAGIGVAALSGPLGCLVVWRRAAYFGDTLSHAALLGVALGFILGISLTAGAIIVCLAIALMLALLRSDRPLSGDALLGILAHGALSFGLLALALAKAPQANLSSYLLGDILAVTNADLWAIWFSCVLVLGGLALLWRSLLALIIDPDLAAVEGTPTLAVRLAFAAMIALAVALTMKISGSLLAAALLVIPAATARPLARTPEGMAVLAALCGIGSVLAGIGASFWFDLPTGPAIVCASVIGFFLSRITPFSRGAL